MEMRVDVSILGIGSSFSENLFLLRTILIFDVHSPKTLFRSSDRRGLSRAYAAHGGFPRFLQAQPSPNPPPGFNPPPMSNFLRDVLKFVPPTGVVSDVLKYYFFFSLFGPCFPLASQTLFFRGEPVS